ncbi:putative CMP-sialic acid transporter [Trypanosoma grayi]|uniref:putative CMP-sialic acid transporter n=1 Tax=Trypanosoma grayi TaxID=71804 RepID=UPI0004F4A750|nr:putative CMP-sialic acid transporter [Trypanosoma grayi]KEG12453.1 putative CMP-sialic acid transporter [Trypanosoma grayi]
MQRHVFQSFRAWLKSCCTIQLVFLVLLTFQNAAAVMLMSYTQQRRMADGSARFAVTHVVMMQEMTKVLASLLWCAIDVYRAVRKEGFRLVQKTTSSQVLDDSPPQKSTPSFKNGSATKLVHMENITWRVDDDDDLSSDVAPLSAEEVWRLFKKRLFAELFHPGALWMMVPAILYAVQNYILFVALANLEPTLFQVTYQTKILVTALLMWMFLGRAFSMKRWMALVVLVFGVAMAQIGSQRSLDSQKSGHPLRGNYAVGIGATAFGVVLSSVASVLVEAIFKSKASSMDSLTSSKNVHLSAYSVMCFVVAQIIDGGGVTRSWLTGSSFSELVQNYFRGFDWLVWVMVLVQALGGLLVAVVIKYSDNIMKAFATGCAIVLSGFCSAYVYAFVPSQCFVLGNVLCLLAIVLYSR